jgi:hypothetical protein
LHTACQPLQPSRPKRSLVFSPSEPDSLSINSHRLLHLPTTVVTAMSGLEVVALVPGAISAGAGTISAKKAMSGGQQVTRQYTTTVSPCLAHAAWLLVPLHSLCSDRLRCACCVVVLADWMRRWTPTGTSRKPLKSPLLLCMGPRKCMLALMAASQPIQPGQAPLQWECTAKRSHTSDTY